MAYSKLIAAVVGMAVLWIKQNTNVDLGDDSVQKITDLIVMLLTAAGVYQVTNQVKESK